MLLFLSLSSCSEALSPAGHERDGVHPRHPESPHQGRQGLRAESPDQRAGTVQMATAHTSQGPYMITRCSDAPCPGASAQYPQTYLLT